MPRVSLILSSHNRPRLVRDAIDSVFDQDSPDWELIVADDGSTAGTMEAIVDACRGDRRVTIIENASGSARAAGSGDQRLVAAVNAALGVARGEYVAYLCDDDYLYPESLRVRAEALAANPEAHVSYGRLRSITYDLSTAWDSSARPRPGRSYPRGSDLDPETGRAINPATWSEGFTSPIGGRLDHNQVMHRRACLDEMGGPPWWRSVNEDPADASFFKRLDALGHQALSVDAYVVTKRYHGMNLDKGRHSLMRE